jgi:hypothetical protein
LAARFKQPIEELSRDDLRQFVDEILASVLSDSTKSSLLCAVMSTISQVEGR